jgi:hypothetical protein
MLALWSAMVGVAKAAPDSVDGVLGAEWTGITPVSVLYNPAAPVSNFSTPTNENSEVAYDIYTRGDLNYVYVGLTTASNYAGGLNFANLYFDTNNATSAGSDLVFEVLNQRVLDPNVLNPFNYTEAGSDIHYALTAGSVSAPSVLEFAVPKSFFMTDPLGVGFPLATTDVQLRLSQSFGYSVAGGTSYGPDRLGVVAVPEPATVILGGISMVVVLGVGLVRRTRRSMSATRNA